MYFTKRRQQESREKSRVQSLTRGSERMLQSKTSQERTGRLETQGRRHIS